ncbi:hypothetical protein B0H14DRAFT_3175123, partial [Mycena olivaceomarginata]
MEGGVRRARLVMRFAVLPVMGRYPLGIAVERGGSMVKALRKHRIAWMGIKSPLRRRGEVRGSCARDVDENAAVGCGWDMAGVADAARCTQRAYFARVWTVSGAYYSLRAPKANAREGVAGEASLDGGRGVAGVEA